LVQFSVSDTVQDLTVDGPRRYADG
jgi:hypothetical protein